MQWYWESSHFKKEVGDLVLDKLFDYQALGRVIPDDFGILINRNNIEAHLQKLLQEQQQYHQTHPQDVMKIKTLAKQVMVKIPCP